MSEFSSPEFDFNNRITTIDFDSSDHQISDEDIDHDNFFMTHPTSDSDFQFGTVEEDEEVEEEMDHEREEMEIEDQKLDDVAKEKAAITAYRDTHPDKDQLLLGGREISKNDAIWSVSSFRPHWGPDKLRDNNPLTYWQSDCPNPRSEHTIDLLFHQATLIRQVSFFIDCEQDESYAPKLISIRGGTNYRDLQEIRQIETDRIVGWVNADITEANEGNPFRVFQLQIAILSTHQDGRDTHIRQVKVYSALPKFSIHDKEEEEVETTHIERRKPLINRIGLR